MKAIVIILFPFFCLLLSFFVLITDSSFTYLLLDNPESIQPTKQLLQYFIGQAEIPEVFDQVEKSHLADVKQIIQYSFILLAIFTLILAICMKNNWRQIIRRGTLLLFALVFFAAIIPFDRLFTWFHQILFPQGNWMFPATSTIITFYPLKFFVGYSIAIALHSVVIAATLNFFEIVSRRG